MASSSPRQVNPSETPQQQPEHDEITRFFDLDAASLAPEEALAGTPAGPGFEPIAGDETSEPEARLRGGALARENPTGGSGPYVFPQSADAWLGSAAAVAGGDPREPEEPALTRSARRAPRAAPIDPLLITSIMQEWERQDRARRQGR